MIGCGHVKLRVPSDMSRRTLSFSDRLGSLDSDLPCIFQCNNAEAVEMISAVIRERPPV